jgi:hypothetical protein
MKFDGKENFPFMQEKLRSCFSPIIIEKFSMNITINFYIFLSFFGKLSSGGKFFGLFVMGFVICGL